MLYNSWLSGHFRWDKTSYADGRRIGQIRITSQKYGDIVYLLWRIEKKIS